MSYKPKSYRKFLAGSVSAAMAATTFGVVGPVDVQTADAAEAFPDVDNDYWASGSIQRLADQGVISGYKDGTYRPGEEINRGQVAAMLVAAFDLDVDENAEPPFEDLNPESYFTPYAAAVKEADLIKGREGNTQFAAGMDLSREQMATILVRAFDLEPRDDVDADVGDLDEAHESHQNNIEILAQYNITNTSDGNFRPKETVTRAQFAAFLDRAIQVDQGVEASVSNAAAVDSTTVEVSFDGEVEDVNAEDFAFDPELAVLDAEDISPSDSEESGSAEGSVVRLTTEEQTADEEYTLSYKGESTGQTITGVSPAVAVEDITPLSTTSFEIDVDGELSEDLDEEDVEERLNVSVVNDDEETEVDLTNVEISEDRESITVEHVDNDLEGTAGTLVVNGFEYDFDYEGIEVESAEATTTSVRSDEDQQLEFTVNGFRNVSIEDLEEAGYEVEFLYNSIDAPFDGDATKEEGIIDASDLEESFRYAVEITDEDGNEFTSEQQTVEVHDDEAVTEVTEVGLFDDNDLWENDYVTSANEGNTIKAIEGINAFGETLDDEEVEFPEIENVTSSDVSVAYYDDGLVVNGEGDVTLTVEFDGIEEPVELDLEVVEDQEITGIEESGTTKGFTTNAQSDSFTVIDQYDEPWVGDGEKVNYSITDEDGEEVGSGNPGIHADGTVNVDFPEDLEGEYTLTFSNDGNEIGTVDLEFVELEGVDEFTLNVDPESVDLNDAIDEDGELDYTDEDLEFTATTSGTFENIELDDDELVEALGNLDGDLQLRTSDASIASLADDGEVEQDEDLEVEEALEFEAHARSEGTATLYLEQVEGDFVTTLAQVDVEVESSIPQVTELSLADDVDALQLTEGDNGWDYDVEDLSADVDLEEYMISNIQFSKNDGQAIITIGDLYGGETFVVDAEEVTEEE
ncbi:S-layer homology domain-containing protein [Alteribacillus sp. JSM 102045]|uniref:S-layer homology domain-containing protein n=1 Tax=Alteribacillus sp. JSM 102045 TaxID=1562101 RepID=UPI0035BFE70A